MPSVEKTPPAPLWILCAVIAVAAILIGGYMWHEFSGSNPGIPNREVHANMYDFRKEAQNGNLGRRTNEQAK